MAGATYGQGFIELSPKLAAGFERMVGSKLDGIGTKLSTVGGALTKGVTLPILAAGAGILKLAADQETAEAKLTSTFKSMGAAAWTNTDALTANAAALQSMSTFGDEAIMEMQSVLLTFGKVTDGVGEGNQVFSDATRLGLDMSAALGTDLQSSALQLGKALNDPVKGVSQLTRVGVSFTEQQKEQIKALVASGDTLGAQKLILSELEKQFGGTAEAIAETTGGKMKQAMNSLGDAGEQLGMIIAPVASMLAEHLKRLAGWFQNLSPQAKQWIVRLLAIAAAVGPVLLVTGKLISAAGSMIKVGVSLVKAFGKIGKAFRILSAIVSANPWLLLIAATVALVILIVKNWDKIKDGVAKVWEKLVAFFKGIPAAIVGFFKGAGQWLLNIGKSIIQGLWDGVLFVWKLVKFWYFDMPLTILGWLAGAALWLLDIGKDIITGLWTGALTIWDYVKTWVTGLPGLVLSAIGNVASLLFNVGKDIITGLWDGLRNIWQKVKDWFTGILSSIPGFFKGILGISSPSKVMAALGRDTMTGFRQGLAAGFDDVDRFLKSRTVGTIQSTRAVAAVLPVAASAGGDTYQFYGTPQSMLHDLNLEQGRMAARRAV